MIDVNRLFGFHLVATSGGYAKAVRRAPYPITQPALHQQVKKLEKEVGVTLLERVGKDTMQATPAGQQLLDFIRPFFLDLPRVVDTLKDGEFDGSLNIHAESLLMRQLLPEWLSKLRRKRPHATLNLQEMARVDIDLLRDGTTDVMIAYLPEVPSDIACQQVATVHGCLVVPRDRAPKRGRPDLQKLADLPFLSYPKGTRRHALQLQALDMQGVKVNPTMAINTADTILRYVEFGLGWSLVPSLDADGPRSRRIAAYPWGRPRISFPIVMAWRKDAPEHPLLDAMIECAPTP